MTQEQALRILKSGKNVFITGAAGSGKTFLLNRYIDWLAQGGINAAVTASTGIAATHLNGITIHSWTGMGVHDDLSEAEIKEITKRGYLRQRFLNTQVLVIDEISMLAHYQLDLADRLFRAFKRTDAPFGGVQVVLCGDFFQLPPIKRRRAPEDPGQGKRRLKTQTSMFSGEESENYGEAKFAYESRAWRELDLKICYLEEQHRTSDADFLAALNAIRDNAAGNRVQQYLQSRVNAGIILPVEPTKLYTHNVDVDIENDLELAKLPGKEFHYKMQLIGPPALSERLQKSCLAPATLRLKTGARVMFVKNNFEEGYVNGTLGVIEHLGEERIMVRTSAGDLIDAGPASWHIAEDGDIKAEINQYPLRLAWAITVHKSQGMSLDAALVDLRQSFEAGMGYVALSRVRSSAGLSLAGFNDVALRVSADVLEFDKKIKGESEEHSKQIFLPRRLAAGPVFAQGRTAAKAAKKPKAKKEKKPNTVQVTRELLEKGMSLEELVFARNMKASTIIDHCEKMKETGLAKDFSCLVKNFGMGKMIQLKAALRKCRNAEGCYPLKPAMELVGQDFASYDELRLARLLL